MEPSIEEKGKKIKLKMIDWCVLAGFFVIIVSMSTPSLSLARQEQKMADMIERLQTVRSHILLYCADHDGLKPGQDQPGESVSTEAFTAAICDYRPTGFSRLGTIPDNPYIADSKQSNKVICVNDPDAGPTGKEGVGWWFNAATGEFRACDSEFHTRY